MTTANNVRRAHELLDGLAAYAELSQEQEKLLRSFLPELPNPVTLDVLLARVHDAWISANPSDWGFDTPAEHHDWLFDLRNDLVRIIEDQDAPAHPEFLETEADYRNALQGTVVARSECNPWMKEVPNEWVCNCAVNGDEGMASFGRARVLRWGWGK